METNIKQDINFLEYPLWMQSNEVAEINGYKYECSDNVPTKVDAIFLYCILMLCQQQDWQHRIITSQYKILTLCGIVPNKERRQRLKESLVTWENVKIEFQGTFLNNKEYPLCQDRCRL